MSLIHSSFEIDEYDYCYKANYIKNDYYILKMKILYEKHYSSLILKKSKSLKLFYSIENIACYESRYLVIIFYIELSIISNSSLNI